MKINFKLMALCLVGYSFAPGDFIYESKNEMPQDAKTQLPNGSPNRTLRQMIDPLSGAYLTLKKDNSVSALDDSGFEEFRNQLFQEHVAPFVIQPASLQPEDKSFQTKIGAEITDYDLKSIKDRKSLLRFLRMPSDQEWFDGVQYVGPSITKGCFSLQHGEQKSFREIRNSLKYKNIPITSNDNFLYELMPYFSKQVVNCFDKVVDVLLFFTEHTADCPRLRRKITQYIYENFHKENISELIKKVMYIECVENDSITLRSIAKDLLSKDLFDELCQFYDIFTIGSRHRQKCYADHQALAQASDKEKDVASYFQKKQYQCSCSIKAAQEIMQFGKIFDYNHNFYLQNQFLEWIGELWFIQFQFVVESWGFIVKFFHHVSRQLNYGVLTKDRLKELKRRFSTPNVWTNPVIFHQVITAMPWLIESVQNSCRNSLDDLILDLRKRALVFKDDLSFKDALRKKFDCFYCKHHYGAAVAKLDNALKF